MQAARSTGGAMTTRTRAPRMTEPYWSDDTCSLYLGDCRTILPALGVTADCIVADPPYGETDLDWDQWPHGWLETVTAVSRSMWCFGSLRMYLEHAAEFRAVKWKFSQDVIWEKHNGSSLRNDRFRRVHEQPTHWYRDAWSGIHHIAPTMPGAAAKTVRHKFKPGHWSEGASYASEDGGPLLMRSVIAVPSMHGRAIHRTEKPLGILSPLIEYACPPGGLVVDPFAGSGSTLDAARATGRRAVGVELHEPYAEAAARRLSQGAFDFGEAS